ncbi:MAG: efflux transporter outer membrane subunit [Burkholderiaceae bacterium]|nr:efflux transporter outer membrane subunit [Burkholderiaceae bacterium]
MNRFATFRRLVLASAVSASLAACAAGPEYKAPDMNMPASYHHAAPVSAPIEQSAPPLDKWWEGFHDPVLTHIVQRVQVNNLDLELAIARVEQGRAAAHLADANLMPKGELNAQAAGQRQSLESPIGKIAHNFPGYRRTETLIDTGVGASWEIDLSGGLHRAREAAAADAEALEADRLAVKVMVQADAADAYFRVREAQTRIALAREQIKTDVALLDLVNLRLKEGLGTRQEQAEAQARVAQVRASVPPLQHELDTQLNRLDILMGALPGTYAAELNTGEAVQAYAQPALGSVLKPQELLRRRPDVVAAERRLASSNARIGVAMSEYYPKLSLGGILGFEGLDTAAMNGATFQPSLIAGLHWRLFDFGRVDAEVAQARGANAEALIRYRSSMLHATEDVENALSLRSTLAEERNEVQAEVEADARARGAAEDAYKGGVTGIVDLLEQDRQLLASRDQLAVAEAGSARATVAAFRALGGGW